MDTIKSLIKSHKMIPHPEGGYYVEVYKNKDVSHIYYLLEKGQYSHWHRTVSYTHLRAHETG